MYGSERGWGIGSNPEVGDVHCVARHDQTEGLETPLLVKLRIQCRVREARQKATSPLQIVKKSGCAALEADDIWACFQALDCLDYCTTLSLTDQIPRQADHCESWPKFSMSNLLFLRKSPVRVCLCGLNKEQARP